MSKQPKNEDLIIYFTMKFFLNALEFLWIESPYLEYQDTGHNKTFTLINADLKVK